MANRGSQGQVLINKVWRRKYWMRVVGVSVDGKSSKLRSSVRVAVEVERVNPNADFRAAWHVALEIFRAKQFVWRVDFQNVIEEGMLPTTWRPSIRDLAKLAQEGLIPLEGPIAAALAEAGALLVFLFDRRAEFVLMFDPDTTRHEMHHRIESALDVQKLRQIVDTR